MVTVYTDSCYTCTEGCYARTEGCYTCTESYYACTEDRYTCTESYYACTEGCYACVMVTVYTDSCYACTEGCCACVIVTMYTLLAVMPVLKAATPMAGSSIDLTYWWSSPPWSPKPDSCPACDGVTRSAPAPKAVSCVMRMLKWRLINKWWCQLRTMWACLQSKLDMLQRRRSTCADEKCQMTDTWYLMAVGSITKFIPGRKCPLNVPQWNTGRPVLGQVLIDHGRVIWRGCPETPMKAQS